MNEKKNTFEITIATDNQNNTINFREGSGPWDGCKISDLPAPLLQMLIALDDNRRVKIIMAEVEKPKAKA